MYGQYIFASIRLYKHTYIYIDTVVLQYEYKLRLIYTLHLFIFSRPLSSISSTEAPRSNIYMPTPTSGPHHRGKIGKQSSKIT